MYRVHLVVIKVQYPDRISVDVHAYHTGGTFNATYNLWSDYIDQELAECMQGFAEYYNLAIVSEQTVEVKEV